MSKGDQQRRRRQRRSSSGPGWRPFTGDALAGLGFGCNPADNRVSEALVKAGHRCAVPGCESTDLTWDHIVPLAKGGSKKSPRNRQVLCLTHNAMKADLSQEEFQALLGVTWDTPTPRSTQAWLVNVTDGLARAVTVGTWSGTGLPLTDLRCLMLAPGGEPCRWRCDDEIGMTRHVAAHQAGELGVVWDNCQTCRYPIRLTKAGVLRVHGPVGERCPGGGKVGRFVLRCRGELG